MNNKYSFQNSFFNYDISIFNKIRNDIQIIGKLIELVKEYNVSFDEPEKFINYIIETDFEKVLEEEKNRSEEKNEEYFSELKSFFLQVQASLKEIFEDAKLFVKYSEGEKENEQ